MYGIRTLCRTTGSPSSLVTVNMTLRNYGVIIKRLYGKYIDDHRSYGIVQNKGKNNKIDLPFLVVCITCAFMAFGGVSERF